MSAPARYDLSILIPARNEQFLALTVESLLKNKRGKTEVLVGLDSEWADPPMEDHPDLTVVYYPFSLGQRAMTNALCRLSKAKYVMKIDAHCTVDEGFDVKMMSEMQDNFTMVPRMYNLHAFDWVCERCGNRWYQGPTPTRCLKSGEGRETNKACNSQNFRREMVWKPRKNRMSQFYRFDHTLHFQYWNEYKNRPEAKGDIADTLSLQGSCFMLTRDKYWELDVCEENFGSWGQQGVEVALKTWLSGGRVVVNKKTWYSHMFRTQGGDFGFPYPISGKQVDHARKYSRELLQGNRWTKAVRTFESVLEQFAPVPDWPNITKKTEPSKGIIYYTDNKVSLRLGHKVRKQIRKTGLPIVSCSLKPMDFGKNYPLKMERGYLAYHRQILTALEHSTADVIFFCEHDVLYHPSHFDFTPPKKDVYYYNTNFWRVRMDDGHALHYDTEQVNFICAYRELLLKHYREKVRRIEKEGFSMKMGFEPGANSRKERIDDYKAERWQSKYPSLDIRHGQNLTRSRWTKEEFRNKKSCEGWKESHISKIPGWSGENVLTLIDLP